MKIKINSEILLKGLEPLSIIIKEKHITPILECVHINVTKTKIQLTGGNSEIGCTNTILFENKTSFTGCINYSLLVAMMRNIPNEEIELDFKEKLVKITHSNGNFKLPKFNSDEYIFIHIEQTDKKATINGKSLKGSLKVANKFVDNSDLLPTSNTLLVIGENTFIKCTNQIILFEEKITGNGDSKDLLLSPNTSSSLSTLLSDEDILFNYNDNVIQINDKNIEIIIIQQQGDFPIKQFDVIMEAVEGGDEISVDNSELKSSLKRIGALTDNEYNNQIKFDINKENLEITCDNETYSISGREELSCVFSSEKTIGYNANLLKELLNVFEEKTKLRINSKNQFCFEFNTKKALLAPVLLNK